MNNKQFLLLFTLLLLTPCSAFSFPVIPTNTALWTHGTLSRGGDYIYTNLDFSAKGEFRWACDTENQLNSAFLFNGTDKEGRSYLEMAKESNLKQKAKLNVVWRIDGGKEHRGDWLAHYRWPGTAAALPTGVIAPEDQHADLLKGMKKGLKLDISVSNEKWQYHSSFSLKRFTDTLSQLSCYKD